MPEQRPADRWPKGTGNPASSALEHAGYHTLEDIARLTERELLAMHGVGPKAVDVLRAALAERGLAFRPPDTPDPR
jgi:DNA-directed RNA polymerase alpha subunit